MIKVDLKANNKEAEAFVEKIASDPMLKDFDVNLNNVNDFANYLEEINNCQKCPSLEKCANNNIGYQTVIENGNFLLKECKYKEQDKKKSLRNSLINTLFVSKSILNADLANFEANTPNRKKIYEYIVDFINKQKNQEFVKGLYIHGAFATGKTYILGCIANELARNDIKSLVIYFPDLVVELKNAIGTERLEELVNYLKSVDVLLIDDFGSENMTPWLRDEMLGSILNYRLMEQKAIFISSNLSFDNELISHLSITNSPSDQLKGNRLKSRLNGLVKSIELDNKEYFR